MPAQTEAGDEALRRAREAARVVLAKHPCVVPGGGPRGVAQVALRLGCDRVLAAYERQDVGRGQHAAGAGGAE